ncbi:MAG: DNA adenine methylase [Anaerolineales bacterium]
MAPNEQLAFDFHSTRGGQSGSPEGVILGERLARVQAGGGIEAGEATKGLWRPIHYLGSKLRLVDEICQVVDEADPSIGPVCDLFSGSGIVAMALSKRREVVAVDVQEYSRVLCSALLSPANVDLAAVDELVDAVLSGELVRMLQWAAEPMVHAEMEALRLAAQGKPEKLCDFLEGCSVIGHRLGGSARANAWLLRALTETASRMDKLDPAGNGPGILTRYYGGVYFSFSQAVQIDGLLSFVRTMAPGERDTYLAALLSAASEAVNTVGKQFAQPIRPRGRDGRPKGNLVKKVSDDRSIDIVASYKKWLARYGALPRGSLKSKALKADFKTALATLDGHVSIVYADPPYTRDHYSRFYHVLETMCLGDAPTIATMRLNGELRATRGLYRSGRHQSPFCIKSKAAGAFGDLFGGVRSLGVPLVLSYSPYQARSKDRPRVVTLDGLFSMASDFFNRVEIHTPARLSHSKLGRSESSAGKRKDAEVLFVCLP